MSNNPRLNHDYGYEYDGLHRTEQCDESKILSYIDGYYYTYNKDKTVSIYSCINSDKVLVRTLKHAIDSSYARMQVGVYARNNPNSVAIDHMKSYLITQYRREDEFHDFVIDRSRRKGVVYSPKEIDQIFYIFEDYREDFEGIL